MVVVYSVDGLSLGSTATVIERRTIHRDGGEVASFEASIARDAGVHTSSQPVRLPAAIAPGVYELRVTIAAAGVEALGSAIFEVKSDADYPSNR